MVAWSILLAALLGCLLKAGRVRLLAATTALLVAVGAWGVRAHLGDWQRAALLRQRILAAAGDVLTRPSCPSWRFEALPDSVGGAYVFRNGFEQALRLSFPDEADRVRDSRPTCVFRWDAGRGRFDLHETR